MEFTIYDDDAVARFLEGLEERPQRRVTTFIHTYFSFMNYLLYTLEFSFSSLQYPYWWMPNIPVNVPQVAQPEEEPAAEKPDEPMEL